MTYSHDWQNNSLFFLVVDSILGGETYLRAKIVVGLLLVTAILFLGFLPTYDRSDVLEKCFWVVVLLFLLNPTAFPWYFIWVVPFLYLFPKPSMILLMLTVSAYYLSFHDDYAWTDRKFLSIPAISWITWGPFLVVVLVNFLMGLFWGKRGYRDLALN